MDIIGICSKLNTISVSNELFFSCNDFFNLLKMDGDIGYIDCIITPFYISNNKRYELYEYELVMSSTESFEQYMEIVTGHKFEAVNKNVIEIRRHCYIELSDKVNSDVTAEVIEYIEYIKNSIKLQNEIKDMFDGFDDAKMFFAIYH